MFNPKIYGILALALAFGGAAPAQAGWNGWQWMPMLEKAHQRQNIAPPPGYEAFAYAQKRTRYRAAPSARPETPNTARRPIIGHTGHIGGF